MPRRALLVFADELHADLARRAFPRAAQPLFSVAALGDAIAPTVDIHFFTSGKCHAAAPALSVHRQKGGTFRARFENAIETIAQLGYDDVVAIGRDCPALHARDIERAFAELKSCRLVLGPDHRGGCYLIAFRSADRALLRDIRWRQNTDFVQLVERGGTGHVFKLPVKHDLDSWKDLPIFARTDHVLAGLAKFLIDVASSAAGVLAHFFSLAVQEIRIRQQMPPPAGAA